MNLDRYLERIGYGGATPATARTLAALHECHAGAIAFENFDVLTGQGISVEPGAVEAKLVGRGRGGYCYEHAILFGTALRALGFNARERLARVRWTDGRDAARGHLVLEVDSAQGTYLADVGFGGRGLLSPLPLVAGAEFENPDGARYRFTREADDGLFLEGDVGAGWEPHYALYATPVTPLDIEMANHFTSTFARSMFRSLLLVQRLTRLRRAHLVNRTLTVRAQGTLLVSELADDDALLHALHDEFGIVASPEMLRAVPARAPV